MDDAVTLMRQALQKSQDPLYCESDRTHARLQVRDLLEQHVDDLLAAADESKRLRAAIKDCRCSCHGCCHLQMPAYHCLGVECTNSQTAAQFLQDARQRARDAEQVAFELRTRLARYESGPVPTTAFCTHQNTKFLFGSGQDLPGMSLDTISQCVVCGAIVHDYRHGGGMRSPNYPMTYESPLVGPFRLLVHKLVDAERKLKVLAAAYTTMQAANAQPMTLGVDEDAMPNRVDAWMAEDKFWSLLKSPLQEYT